MPEILEAVLDAANDAVVAVDGGGNVLLWNPRAEAMFGYGADEMRGQPLSRIIPERFRELHAAGIARVAAGGTPRVIGQTVELAALHRDGREFPVELSLGRWDAEGETFFTGIVRDVTERKELLRDLAQSRAQAAALLDAANDAVIAIDSSGNVLLWNPRAEAMFGHAFEEMSGQPLTRIIPERFRDGHAAGIARVTAGGTPRVIGQTVELAAQHRDGREFPIELSLGRWQADGETFFTGIIRDVTERKLAEERTRKIGESLAEKNEMLEGLSAKLAKYLSRSVYESIFEGRTEVRVNSYRKMLTVFFSDIQGFTDLAERLEAEALSELLNNYLGEMSKIAEGCGGTIDKFMGDGIMIFFGDPESQGEDGDALACVRMAIEMRRRVHELQQDWRRQTGSVQLHVRMGVNSGFCTVGNFGSDERLDYTIVGREVNLASRLETTAEPDQILLSHKTWELVKDEIPCEPIGDLTVKGFTHPVKTYAVIPDELHDDARPIRSTASGFSLELEPDQLQADEADAVRQALRRALHALDGGD